LSRLDGLRRAGGLDWGLPCALSPRIRACYRSAAFALFAALSDSSDFLRVEPDLSICCSTTLMMSLPNTQLQP
jgi:hypothetical protein